MPEEIKVASAPDAIVEKYHYCIVPCDGEPVMKSPTDRAALLAAAGEDLAKCRAGWCHFVIDGKRYYLSQPRQSFVLRGPGGDTIDLPLGSANVVCDPSGRFEVLGRAASNVR